MHPLSHLLYNINLAQRDHAAPQTSSPKEFDNAFTHPKEKFNK